MLGGIRTRLHACKFSHVHCILCEGCQDVGKAEVVDMDIGGCAATPASSKLSWKALDVPLCMNIACVICQVFLFSR